MPCRNRNSLHCTVCLYILAAATAFATAGTTACLGQTNPMAAAGSDSQSEQRSYSKYVSRHIVLYTDLYQSDAIALLKRLESTIANISKYWGRKSSDPIECYVVRNLEAWRHSDFPHAFARPLIAGIGGGAFATRRTDRKKPTLRVTVYSTAIPGTAEHEIVHAYCGQTFGTTGPDWYKEGMAELAFHRHSDQLGVECDAGVIQFLCNTPFQSVQDIVNSGELNADLKLSFDQFRKKTQSETDEQQAESLRIWLRENGDSVRSSRETYRWCWVLCHFLNNNPNYSQRFRLLGKRYLSRDPRSFDQMFGSMQKEMDFEYKFFLDRIDVGYRVDLCHWNWKRKFTRLEGDRTAAIRIKASGGYQPSGMLIQRGVRYAFRSSDSWKINGNSHDIGVDGDEQGLGRLVGVVMSDYKLSKRFDLGTDGSFIAPQSGKLYLRCKDRWNELHDNQGSVEVQLRIREPGRAAEESSGSP